jgi:general stress protein 26
MSNNGEVEYEGDSYFFTWEDSTKVKNIQEHPMASLAFQGNDMLFIHVNGEASLIHQRARMEPYWNKELERWFPEGLDTPGVVMIKVSARHIKYWHKEDEGEITL